MFVNKSLLEQSHVHWFALAVYGCFLLATAELSSDKRDHVPKAKIILYLALDRESLLIHKLTYSALRKTQEVIYLS